MSKFLAPIHYWLFNKIKVHEDLEAMIIDDFKREHGNEIDEIQKANIEKYGERLPDAPLADIIDTSNIHGWLQNKISIAETRQAAILGDLFCKYHSDGILLAKSIFENNAIKWGEEAKKEYDVTTAEDIFKVINNYILDGMPCDNVNRVVKADADYLEYVQEQCLHIGYWNKAGVDPKVMYDLRATWVGAFVNTVNSSFKHQIVAQNADGREVFVGKIFKK